MRPRVEGRVGMGWWLELASRSPGRQKVTAESLLGVGRSSVLFLAADSDDMNSNEGRMW